MKVTYIGHATLLIELGGRRILTDPNFDPSLWGILPRVSEPGIALEALPALDLVLLTHAHADHLSLRSLRALESVPIYAPPAVSRWIEKKGVRNVIPLNPGEEAVVGPVTIHAERATHRGSRYGVDRWGVQANMYLLATNSKSVFFAGDTGLENSAVDLMERTVRKEGTELDVALLPIGYAPKWKPRFRRGHLSAMDALSLFERLEARHFIPYHWGTFRHVTSTAFDAIRELRQHVRGHVRESDVVILEPGESFEEPA